MTILTFHGGAIHAIRIFCRWARCRKADLLTLSVWADFGLTWGRLWADRFIGAPWFGAQRKPSLLSAQAGPYVTCLGSRAGVMNPWLSGILKLWGQVTQDFVAGKCKRGMVAVLLRTDATPKSSPESRCGSNGHSLAASC